MGFKPAIKKLDRSGLTEAEVLDLIPEQSYSVFIYNSSGSQSGNRFKNFADLMTAIGGQEGYKLVYIEKDEILPSGAYNFDYVEFRGNGKSYDQGGFTVTFPTGVTITSWTFGVIDSLRFRSTSTSPIWTTASGFLLQINTQAELWSTTAPFIKNTGGGQCIISLGRAGRLKDDGSEVFETTASAFGCVLVVTRNDSSTVANETLKSSNSVVFLDLAQSTGLDFTNATFPSEHSGLSIGVDFSGMQSYWGTLVGLKKVHSSATSITPQSTASINQISVTASAGTFTINAPTGYKSVQTEFELVIYVTNNQTYSWNSVYRGSASIALPASISAGKMDRIKFLWNDADSKWDLIRFVGGF